MISDLNNVSTVHYNELFMQFKNESDIQLLIDNSVLIRVNGYPNHFIPVL